MKIVFETGGPNNYAKQSGKSQLITLEQSDAGDRLFRLTYGLQVFENMPYGRACKELGVCILHSLCCEGIASNEGE